jgi:redox-sensitive bicupin YhaK (pirin superfamily)
MITIRPGANRGHANHGWLDTWHSFSFSSYYDPERMGYRSLRVINDDVIAPAKGFGMHPHEDMEIITYMLGGELSHRDSMGRSAVLRRGDVQRMSAGTGIVHSEFNASHTTPAHLLQIWIEPAQLGVKPRYDDRTLPAGEIESKLGLIASPDGAGGALSLFQDARVYAGRFAPGTSASHALAPGRGAWVQVADGAITVDGKTLERGDAAVIEDVRGFSIGAGAQGGEALVFDLA